MLSSSALALLMSSYILQLVNNAWELNKYVRAYYIAWGWVESELTKIKNHTFWYESNINSGSSINDNFKLNWNKIDSYYVSGQVLSKSNVWASWDVFWLTDCSDKNNYFQLSWWQGFIIPLYFDKVDPTERYYWSGDSNGNIKYLSNFQTDISDKITIFSTWAYTASWAVTVLTSWEDTYNNFEIISKNTKSFSWHYNYNLNSLFSNDVVMNPDVENHLIMVSTNETNKPLEGNHGVLQPYCLTFSNDLKLPSPITKILMQWYYWDRVVSLQVTKKTQLPEYLIYTSNSQ